MIKVKITDIAENEGKQKGYDVRFRSSDDLENWHSESRGVPTSFHNITEKGNIVELSTCFDCKGIKAHHWPNMATRTVIIIDIVRHSGNLERYKEINT